MSIISQNWDKKFLKSTDSNVYLYQLKYCHSLLLSLFLFTSVPLIPQIKKQRKNGVHKGLAFDF